MPGQLPVIANALADILCSAADAVKRIRKYIEERPNLLNDTNTWIHGGGWDNSLWPGWPTAVITFPILFSNSFLF